MQAGEQSQVKNSNTAHFGLRAEVFLVFHTVSRTPNPPGRPTQFSVCFKIWSISEGITICPMRCQSKIFQVNRAFPEDLFCPRQQDRQQPPGHSSTLLGKISHQHTAGPPAPLCRSPCPAFTSCYSAKVPLSSFFSPQNKKKKKSVGAHRLMGTRYTSLSHKVNENTR